MARTVFFSFHYQRDIWRVNQVRSIPNITGNAAAGFNPTLYRAAAAACRSARGGRNIIINAIKVEAVLAVRGDANC